MTCTKPTNPKDAIGSDKAPLHLWPATATLYGALGLLDGALKYGRGNWRVAGVRASIYVDAIQRHLDAYREGEYVDPDSGLPHLAHLLASAAILVDAGAMGKLTNDVNYSPSCAGSEYRKQMSAFSTTVQRLRAKHANKHPVHYSLANTP